MFKRVQLKFFGIITAILIAIFIAVLSSVNIIMDLLMERQTKVVLQQVAAGVEYDDKTETFTFTDPERHKADVPPPKDKPGEDKTSAAEPGTEQPSSEPETAAVTTSAEEKTEPTKTTPTQPVTVGEKPSEAGESPTEKETDALPPTEAQKPEPTQPTEILPTEGQNFEQPPDMPYDPWQGGWGYYGGWGDNPWNGGEPPHHIWGQDGESTWQNRGEEKPVVTYPPVEPQVFSSFVTVSRLNNDPPDERHEKMDTFPKSGSIDFFVIMANEKGEYVSSLNNDDLTADTAQEYIDSVLNRGKTSGMVGNMSYCAEKKSNGSLLVLTDRTAEMNMMHKLKRTTVVVGLVSLIILSVAAYFVSGLIVRPLKETFEKQKQFISDASHELKTPLTVISVNADVLSGEVGDNKWLNYIRDQASRMNVLVNDLLSLTRLENKTRDFIRTDFDLSAAVTNAALPFECQAFENRRNFVLNVEEGIMINGSEQHIKQLTAIFIDNAIKYSKEGGTVRVSLGKEDGKTVLSVYNTGSGVKESEKDKLFERFYRSDESRNRSTGGYGLGLAIARSIIDKHKFKVVVENDEGRSICFKVIM